MTRRFRALLLAAPLLATAATGPVAAQEPQLLSAESSGILDLEDESRLVVEGIQGVLSVRVGKEGQLRYMARAEDRRSQQPVELVLEGRTLKLRPPAGLEDRVVVLEVAVSPGLAVVVRTSKSKLSAGGLRSPLTVRGEAIELDARGLFAGLDCDIEGGKARIESVQDDVVVAGSDLALTVNRIGGFVTLSLRASQVELRDVKGEVDADLDDSTLDASALQKRIRITAVGGRVDLKNVSYFIDLNLDDSPLSLSESAGEVEIESNAEVQFQNVKGKLHLTGYGGAVRGQTADAELSLATYGAEVVLADLRGPTRISGDDLRLQIKGAKGDVTVEASSSVVDVENAEGTLEIQTDYGDVTIRKAAKSVKVTSREGDVSVSELSGPLELRASGNRVEVSWKAMSTDKDTYVENETGDVLLHFPSNVGGRIDVQASYGRIESQLPGIRVSDDGNSAAGVLRRTNRPAIQVRSGGDVYLNAIAAKTEAGGS